jgi:hypothetical protein
MTLICDLIIAAGDETDRRAAVARAREALGDAALEESHRCAHCAHCNHCNECPFRLDLEGGERPLGRLVLERLDKYYMLMGGGLMSCGRGVGGG